MKVELHDNRAYVLREEGDPKYYTESALWYAIKKELIKQGHDVVKELDPDSRLWHHKQYSIRERAGDWYLWYGSWQIFFIYEEYNRTVKVRLERIWSEALAA